jgi:hypothetical protein
LRWRAARWLPSRRKHWLSSVLNSKTEWPCWVRAWLDMRLWQDGIGVVPDRDNDHDPVRIDPSSVRKARELLRWALCRVAHSPEMWLDVETFVRKLAFWLADEGV